MRMGNKDKGKRETKKAPKPRPKAEPARRHDEFSQVGVHTIREATERSA